MDLRNVLQRSEEKHLTPQRSNLAEQKKKFFFHSKRLSLSLKLDINAALKCDNSEHTRTFTPFEHSHERSACQSKDQLHLVLIYALTFEERREHTPTRIPPQINFILRFRLTRYYSRPSIPLIAYTSNTGNFYGYLGSKLSRGANQIAPVTCIWILGLKLISSIPWIEDACHSSSEV